MLLRFSKYHGTGNDFCMLDGRELPFDVLSAKQIAHLCHRRFGIGADGLIFLRNDDKADFFMDYFNADGKRSTMCGNGGRCIVKYAKDLGIVSDQCRFSAMDGVHEAKVNGDVISLKMKDVKAWERDGEDLVLDTGSPHYIRMGKFSEHFDVVEEGSKIRNSEKYHELGINVNFVERLDDKKIKVATFERGVEDETYSCGTGVVAAAIASHIVLKDLSSIFDIQTKGGSLKVSFSYGENEYTDVWLTGPAVKVFDGTITI